jgi:rRNA maturation endonuclease Nob1
LDSREARDLKKVIWESDVNKQYKFSCRNTECRYTLMRSERIDIRACPECGTEVQQHKMAKDESWRERSRERRQ